MNKAKDLKIALTGLFLTGTDAEHDERDMAELLDGIDFHELLQAICNEAEVVYQYHAYGETDKDFHYHGPMLLPAGSVMLCDEATDCTNKTALCYRALELWLLPDMSFAVTSRFCVVVDNGRYETVYRTIKGRNWKEAGMTIDFLQLADDLADMCLGVSDDETPMFEV